MEHPDQFELDAHRRDDELDWPCDRRDAHAPHPALPTACPGVDAHPNTMIGRDSVPRKRPREQEEFDW